MAIQVFWSKPVAIYLPPRTRLYVTNTRHAAELLLSDWPEAYRQARGCIAARVACLQALEGKVSTQWARAAFIRAAKEAGVFLVDRGG